MEIDPALVERMVAVLLAYTSGDGREYAKRHGRSVYAEACAIVAALPERAALVDPDEQYARDLLRQQGWANEPSIGSEAVVRMIAMAHRRQESTR